MINHGILLYKDTFCPVPPFFGFKEAALLAVFGNHLIALRAFGLVDRICLAVLLYAWLTRLFRPRIAALAAIVTTVLGSLDYADTLDVYSQDAMLFSIASALSASYALDKQRSVRATALCAVLSGAFALLCLITKQTVGLGNLVVIPIVVSACLYRLSGVKKARNFLIGYVGAGIVGTSSCALWAAKTGILSDGLAQMFVKGQRPKLPVHWIFSAVFSITRI